MVVVLRIFYFRIRQRPVQTNAEDVLLGVKALHFLIQNFNEERGGPFYFILYSMRWPSWRLSSLLILTLKSVFVRNKHLGTCCENCSRKMLDDRYSHIHFLSLTLPLTHSHSPTHSLSHSLTQSLTLTLNIPLARSLSFTLSLTHSLSLSLSHSITHSHSLSFTL